MKRTEALGIFIPQLNLSGKHQPGQYTTTNQHKSFKGGQFSQRSSNPHLKTQPQFNTPTPFPKSMLNVVGRTEIGKSDYSKRLLYENQAIHNRYSELQRSYNELQASLQALNDQYKSLKSAFVALNNTSNKHTASKEVEANNLDESNSDINAAEDDADDVDTVRMLLELESATKVRLQQEHRQLQSELESLRGEGHLLTMRHSNIENVLRLERQNGQLRQIIKKMSEMMAGEGRHAKQTTQSNIYS